MIPVPALEIAGVSHSYGARLALDDVSLAVAPGRFMALLGLNGAGKTTLLSLVTRLFDTRRGRIRVMGYRIDTAPREALRRLGVVFQARTLDLDLTVRDNLLFHAALHGISGQMARARAEAVLDDVGLTSRAADRARSLSGGQMRRVEIARALLHAPRLLVLDEPTVGLDVASKAAILAQVRALVARDGVAVLWTTHLFDEVAPDDDVAVLHKGRVMAQGAAGAVIAAQRAATLPEAFAVMTREAA